MLDGRSGWIVKVMLAKTRKSKESRRKQAQSGLAGHGTSGDRHVDSWERLLAVCSPLE